MTYTTTSAPTVGFVECRHCGMWHTGTCPRIKAIEYFPDGTIKRVEYHGTALAKAEHDPRDDFSPQNDPFAKAEQK